MREAEDEGDAEGQDELENQLALLAHTFLIVLEYLDIVVREAYASAPHGGEKEQLHVDVAEVADQQGAHQQRCDDDDAAHGRGALFLHLAFQAEVAYGLADLGLLQAADDGSAGEECEEHAYHHGRYGPERQERHQVVAREVDVLEKIEEMV